MDRLKDEGRMDGKLSGDLQKLLQSYKKEKKHPAQEDNSLLQNDKYLKIDRVRHSLISKITLTAQSTNISSSCLEQKAYNHKQSETSITKLGRRPRKASKDLENCTKVNSKYLQSTDKNTAYKEYECVLQQLDCPNTPSMKESHTTNNQTGRNTDCSTIRTQANVQRIENWSNHTPNKLYGMIIESPCKENNQKDLDIICIEIKTPIKKQLIKKQSEQRLESSSKESIAIKRVHALNPSPQITPKTSNKKLKVNQQSIERSVRLPSSEKKRKYIDLMSQRPSITKKTLITCEYMPTNPF